MIIFFDGSCKFCTKQADRLRSLDKLNNLELIDLSNDPLICQLYGIDYNDAIKQIHGTDGLQVFKGADLIREIIKKLGWNRVCYFLSLPLIKQIFNLLFSIVSMYRKY